MYAPVRGGNRGGHDQFEWENVKLMSYKDRECYLGASQTLGYLDKGGKWRRRDWYAQASSNPKAADARKDKLKAEVELKKAEEKALMNYKLGIADDMIKGCQDVKQVLEAVRAKFLQTQAEMRGESMAGPTPKISSLSAFEIKELTQRMSCGQSDAIIKPSDIVVEEDDPEMILQRADRVKGVGFDKQHILSMSAKALATGEDPRMNTIGAKNVQDLKYLDQQKKLSMISFLTEKIKKEKEQRKEEKASRREEKRRDKDKKVKKKHHRRRSPSSESERSPPRRHRRSRSRSSSEDRDRRHRSRHQKRRDRRDSRSKSP